MTGLVKNIHGIVWKCFSPKIYKTMLKNGLCSKIRVWKITIAFGPMKCCLSSLGCGVDVSAMFDEKFNSFHFIWIVNKTELENDFCSNVRIWTITSRCSPMKCRHSILGLNIDVGAMFDEKYYSFHFTWIVDKTKSIKTIYVQK